jgi:hypothetical protein
MKRPSDGSMPRRSHVRHDAAFDADLGAWQDDTSRGTKRKRSTQGTEGTEARNQRTSEAEGDPGSTGLVNQEGAIPEAALQPTAQAAEVDFPPLAIDPDPFEADEEAAAAMGRLGGFDEEADAGSLERRPRADPADTDATMEIRQHQADENMEVENHTAAGVRSRRMAARAMLKEEVCNRAKTATKRAIEFLAADLRQGPRDGAERLRALRQRIKDKQAANTKSEEIVRSQAGDLVAIAPEPVMVNQSSYSSASSSHLPWERSVIGITTAAPPAALLPEQRGEKRVRSEHGQPTAEVRHQSKRSCSSFVHGEGCRKEGQAGDITNRKGDG